MGGKPSGMEGAGPAPACDLKGSGGTAPGQRPGKSGGPGPGRGSREGPGLASRRTLRWAGPPGAGRTEERTVQRAALTMSSMVLSSITESGSMAAPAAPPRSPRAAANGPGGGGDGGGGRGGGGSRTHSRCQPARAAGSSALPFGERSTQSEDYSSRQAPRAPQSVVGTRVRQQATLSQLLEAEFGAESSIGL